jgi:hypothetical protein
MRDLARFRDLEVVVYVLGHRPQDAGVAIEFEEAEELPDADDVTVREQDRVAPEVPVWLGRAIAARVVGEDLLELGAPLVQHLAPHVHQERHGAVARGEKVQTGLDPLRLVRNDAGRRARRLGAGQITDGAQLLDQRRLQRGRGPGRRMGGGHRLLSGGLRLLPARENARSQCKEDDEEAAGDAEDHRDSLATQVIQEGE